MSCRHAFASPISALMPSPGGKPPSDEVQELLAPHPRSACPRVITWVQGPLALRSGLVFVVCGPWSHVMRLRPGCSYGLSSGGGVLFVLMGEVGEVGEVVYEAGVDFAGEVAFEAADEVFFGHFRAGA
jgi:hypothetical protein